MSRSYISSPPSAFVARSGAVLALEQPYTKEFEFLLQINQKTKEFFP
jgi:hypothetical protein